jgi:hypothetical protein
MHPQVVSFLTFVSYAARTQLLLLSLQRPSWNCCSPDWPRSWQLVWRLFWQLDAMASLLVSLPRHPSAIPHLRSLPTQNSEGTEKCRYKSMPQVGFEPAVVFAKIIANKQKLSNAGTEGETHMSWKVTRFLSIISSYTPLDGRRNIGTASAHKAAKP